MPLGWTMPGTVLCEPLKNSGLSQCPSYWLTIIVKSWNFDKHVQLFTGEIDKALLSLDVHKASPKVLPRKGLNYLLKQHNASQQITLDDSHRAKLLAIPGNSYGKKKIVNKLAQRKFGTSYVMDMKCKPIAYDVPVLGYTVGAFRDARKLELGEDSLYRKELAYSYL